LDNDTGKAMIELIFALNRERGTTLVLVTHDPEVASRADRKIVLRDGMVVEDTLPFVAEAETTVAAGAGAGLGQNG
jgi:ABC-type lipoprotein export system ATPase subunit